MADEFVYKSRNNSIQQELYADSVLQTTIGSSLTKVGINFQGTVYDSDTYTTSFDWTTRGAEGIIILKLAALPITGYDPAAELIVWDPTNTDGIVWDTIAIRVIEDV